MGVCCAIQPACTAAASLNSAHTAQLTATPHRYSTSTRGPDGGVWNKAQRGIVHVNRHRLVINSCRRLGRVAVFLANAPERPPHVGERLKVLLDMGRKWPLGRPSEADVLQLVDVQDLLRQDRVDRGATHTAMSGCRIHSAAQVRSVMRKRWVRVSSVGLCCIVVSSGTNGGRGAEEVWYCPCAGSAVVRGAQVVMQSPTVSLRSYPSTALWF